MPAESWKTPLAKFAAKAGFETAPIVALVGAPNLPVTALLWRSRYAHLLVVPIETATETALRAAAALGQEWLDVSCMAEERTDHRVMDAYLLLVSGEPLPGSLFAIVQEIELDPTACRKHVVWPYPGADEEDEEIVWRRLLRVTALGLPASPAASGMTNTPVLNSEFQIRLLKDVKDLRGRAAARQHAEHPLADDSP
jgi:hypothetical protein